jgi:hypothetical protein
LEEMSCATGKDDRLSTGEATRTAPARVCFSLWAYFGFARNVNSVGPACSMPATPVISSDSLPPLISHPSVDASSESLISSGYAQTRAYAMAGTAAVPKSGPLRSRREVAEKLALGHFAVSLHIGCWRTGGNVWQTHKR